MATQSILVGRQEIYDVDLDVAAYELLHRSTAPADSESRDGDRLTNEVLVNALLEIGLDQLTGSHLGFVNFTRSLLIDERPLPFDPDRVAVEVLDDVPPDDEVRSALTRLRVAGYRIALDDYLDDDERASLVELADVVKVDLRGCDERRLPETVDRLRRFDVQLLAEKVETLEEFERCRDLGFELFQGFFLSRPVVVEGRGLPDDQLSLLRLLAKLQDPESSFDDVIALLKQNVALCVKLLRYVNSSSFGLRRNVESVQQAAALLGLDRIRRVVALITVSSASDKPPALFSQTLTRARLCETLAHRIGLPGPESCFMVGLFSQLDALMDQPLPTILAQLPVTEDIRDALLSRSGEMGRLLDIVLAFERGDWSHLHHPALDDAALQTAYLDAVAWIREFEDASTEQRVA